MNYLYDAFISFAWQDLRRARRLHEQLSAGGYVTWYAEKNMRAGDDLPKALWEGLEKSRYVFVVHSRHYAGGAWAERELSVATRDEIDSRINKIVFLTYDDAPVPYGMRHKLYVDFRDRRTRPLDRLTALLNEASDGVIRGVAEAMAAATDIDAIRAGAHRLSAIGRLRQEQMAVSAVADILLRLPTSYHVTDSAAWTLGDIGVWNISDEIAREVRSTIERCLATGDERLIDKMAYISGEIALAARHAGLRRWAEGLIAEAGASDHDQVRIPFLFTRQRIDGLRGSPGATPQAAPS